MATSKEVPPFPLLNASKEGEDSNMESSPSIEHDSSFLIMDISLEESHQLASLNNELEQILDIKNSLSTPPPILNMSPLECHALQLEETEVIKAIFDNDVVPLNDECTCFYVKIKFLADEINDDDVIRIWFSFPPLYPAVPPVFEIETNQSNSFTFSQADELFDLLTQSALSHLGNHMIYDLITLAQEHMHTLIEKEKKKKETPPTVVAIATETTPIQSEGRVDEEAMPDLGARYDDEYYRPKEFVGSIADIIKKLPDNVQITRVENILRQDLAARFASCHKEMISKLWQKERRYPQMYNLKPQVAFHGTLFKSLPSIVQKGLIIPGSDSKVHVRCGSSLGLGIYLSPNPTFSLGYSDTSRLIVCAALLGRIYRQRLDSRDSDRYVSVISSSENEWVFFNAAQVLPCYVIQVTITDECSPSKQYNPPPLASLLNEREEGEEDRKKKQEKLMARARKYLPYGFGPGTNTVILEASEIDDDEEDYGDYQLLRYEEERDSDYYREEGTPIKEESELQPYRYKYNYQ